MKRIIMSIGFLMAACLTIYAEGIGDGEDDVDIYVSEVGAQGLNLDSYQTSNGKPSGSNSKKKSELTSATQLNVYPLFGKYKRHKDCSLTIINNGTFIRLDVRGNKKIVEEVRALVEKDAEQAISKVQTFNSTEDNMVLGTYVGTIGYTERLDGKSCEIFLSGSSAIPIP